MRADRPDGPFPRGGAGDLPIGADDDQPPPGVQGEGEALDAALAVYAGVAAVDRRGDDVPARWRALRL